MVRLNFVKHTGRPDRALIIEFFHFSTNSSLLWSCFSPSELVLFFGRRTVCIKMDFKKISPREPVPIFREATCL